MTEIRWHGRGGQGGFTASKLLGLSASLFEDKYALAFPAFGPERRGAPVLAFTKLDDKKITDRSEPKTCDYIVILDETLADESIISDVREGGKVIINSNHPEKYEKWKKYNIITFDATSVALDILKKPITNTAMLAALAALTDILSLESLIKGMEKSMSKALLDKNVRVVKTVYEKCKEATR